MRDKRPESDGRAVPSSRMARFGRFSGMASSVVGAAAAEGVRRLASGERPQLRDLLLTPANAHRVADRLAEMRGAAMKVGQLLSMEAGDILPKELSEILARLRADATPMPAKQLKSVLGAAWGPDFLRRFARFDVAPLAAASIGQVHRAVTRDGRDLAVKVQYPGVRESIDSDVDNVAMLARASQLLPGGLDIAPLLAEAKRQLHDEADYAREAGCMARYRALLDADPAFATPEPQADLSTDRLLAMTYLEGRPIERVADAPQEERDRVAALLMRLTLRELFEFRLMQTDPNFANYRYDPAGRRVILLDFGATREIPEETSERYRAFLHAGLGADRDALRAAAIAVGVFAEDTADHHQDAILAMIDMARAPYDAGGGVIDFGVSGLTAELREAGMRLGADRTFLHVPPIDTLFIQRKLAGMYLLAARLRARVDLKALLTPHL